MTPSQLYRLWAPGESIWSPWAKPTLLADDSFSKQEPAQESRWRMLPMPFAQNIGSGIAIILDLPAANGIWYGLLLGARGFRPVPLYNGVAGPTALIDSNVIRLAMHQVEDGLNELQSKLSLDAPPVFLLDSNRQSNANLAAPGKLDNRWCVFPQDFPSANLLLSRGLNRVLLVQAEPAAPMTDLTHVLLRYHQACMQILNCGINSAAQPTTVQVKRPSNFRGIGYLALALAGLRRNSAGGFGSIIPAPGSGGGFG
jgi:hypothetical protein